MIFKHTININDSLIRLLFLSISVGMIYSIPALSHVVGLPIYLLEPMKLVVFTSIISFDRKTALFTAVTIPLFSFLLTGHPLFPKFIIITVELLLLVDTYYYLSRKLKSSLVPFFVSIILSKAAYYIIKFVLISTGMLHLNLVSTSLYIQAIVSVVHIVLFIIILYGAKKCIR